MNTRVKIVKSITLDLFFFMWLVGPFIGFALPYAAGAFTRRMRSERKPSALMDISSWLMAYGATIFAAAAMHNRFQWGMFQFPWPIVRFLIVAGALMAVLGSVVYLLYKLQQRSDPMRNAPPGPGEPGYGGVFERPVHPAFTGETDPLTASARLTLAALSRRSGPASSAFASSLAVAIENGDHQTMADIIDRQSLQQERTASRGSPPRPYAGGRPRLIDLSDYLERQERTASTSAERMIYRAGIEGERDALAMLVKNLDSRYPVFSGYRNEAGETDTLIIGPPGVCAVEVKAYQGLIEIEGQRWTRTRHDRFGQPSGSVEQIADRGGRSPSRQVNEVADVLERRIAAAHRRPIDIRRVVAVAGGRAELGAVRNPDTDAALRVEHLSATSMFGPSDYKLTEDDISALVSIAEASHIDD